MSPEQTRGRGIDTRTDVWAFGSVLFEMLSGRSAFRRSDVADVMAAVIRGQPEWSELPAGLHSRVRVLLERCLEKDPKDRLSAISDARVEVRKVLADPEGLLSRPVTAVAHPSRHSKAAWVTAAILAVAAGAGTWYLKPETSRPVIRFQQVLPSGQNLSIAARPLLAVSPDGLRVAYVDGQRLWVRDLNAFAPRAISPPDDLPTNPFFSPDGQWIGYWSAADVQIKRVALDAGPPVPIADSPQPLGFVTWMADDTIVFAQPTTGTMRVSAFDGVPETLIAAEGRELGDPQILPDGETILFDMDDNQIVVQSPGSTEPTLLFQGNRPRFIPTGHILYELDGVLMARAFGVSTLQAVGGAVSVVDGVGNEQYAVSDSGSLAYFAGFAASEARSLRWVDRGGGEELIPAEPQEYLMPRLSFDERRIALDVRGSDNDIVAWDFLSETSTLLTPDAAFGVYPVWTRDSADVAYRRGRDFYRQPANATGSATVIVENLGEGNGPDPYFFEDDAFLIFREQGHPDSGDNIGRVPVDGGSQPEWLLREVFDERNAELSPDGRWIAYQSNETGDWEIYVRSYPALDEYRGTISNAGGIHPVWARGTDELFYIQPGSSAMMMSVRFSSDPGFVLEEREALFDVSEYLTNVAGRTYDVSSDGRFLMLKDTAVLEEGDASPRQINVVWNWFDELLERAPVP